MAEAVIIIGLAGAMAAAEWARRAIGGRRMQRAMRRWAPEVAVLVPARPRLGLGTADTTGDTPARRAS